MSDSRLVATVSSALALVLAASQATAQTAASASQTPAAETQGQGLSGARGDDIVVTAQKREQALYQVPQSISVVGGQALEARQARSISDFAQLVPGLSFEQPNPGRTRVILRGINSGDAGATVAVYLDDVPFGSSTSQVNGAVLAGDFDTFDIERLEVLRGPQGTLYGSNSLGGLIKYVTKAPVLGEYEGKARAGVEQVYHGGTGYSGNAVLNVPLGDKIAVRASGFYHRTGGFIDAIGRADKNVNSADSYGGRGSLLFQPDDKFTVRLTAVLQNIRVNSRTAYDAVPGSLKPTPVNPVTNAPVSGENIYQIYPDRNSVNYRLYTGTLEYDFGFAKLTSVTSYSRLRSVDRSDVSFVDLGGITLGDLASSAFYNRATPDYGVYYSNGAKQKKFTQEVRLASPSSDTFEWLVGAYYTREPGQLLQRYLPYSVTTAQPVSPPPDIIPGNNSLLLGEIDAKYREIAGFGSVTLHVTPRFDVTAGGRYSHNRQSTLQILSGALAGFTTSALPGKSSESVFTWSVSPRYQLGDRSELYVRVAKGYRPGGPNAVPPGSPADFPRTVKADTLISYEGGVRAETPDRVFGIDASVYYLDWKNTPFLQAFQTSVGNINATGNAKGAHSYGAEATATVRPLAGLSFVGSLAYNRTHLLGDNLSGGKDGDSLPYAPHWNASLSADYGWTMGDISPYVGADIARVGRRFGNFDVAYEALVGSRARLPGYTTANLRAGAKVSGFDVSLYVKNVGNSRGLVSVGTVGVRPGGTVAVSPIMPRTVGATVGYAF